MAGSVMDLRQALMVVEAAAALAPLTMRDNETLRQAMQTIREWAVNGPIVGGDDVKQADCQDDATSTR